MAPAAAKSAHPLQIPSRKDAGKFPLLKEDHVVFLLAMESWTSSIPLWWYWRGQGSFHNQSTHVFLVLQIWGRQLSGTVEKGNVHCISHCIGPITCSFVVQVVVKSSLAESGCWDMEHHLWRKESEFLWKIKSLAQRMIGLVYCAFGYGSLLLCVLMNQMAVHGIQLFWSPELEDCWPQQKV